MTDTELLRLCKDNDALWIERDSKGRIHVEPNPGDFVRHATSKIGTALYKWAKYRGGKIFRDQGFILPDNAMFGCSLAWMPNEKWERIASKEGELFPPLCPDFVIEVLSPFGRLEKLQRKMGLWIRNGAQVAWLVNDELRTVEIYRVNESVKVLAQPVLVRGDSPVVGFEIDMNEVWS